MKIPESKKEPRPITISEALEHFIGDAEARELVPDTLRKYKQLDRLMREFAEQKGIADLRDLTVEMSRSFRATWTRHNSAAAKRLDYFKAFFRFCQDAGWGMDNPGKKLKPHKLLTRLRCHFRAQK